VGVPAVLPFGNDGIERFLEPSFTARAVVAEAGAGGGHAAVSIHEGAASAAIAIAPEGATSEATAHLSTLGELGLMGLSVLIGVVGILTAYRFYVRAPEIAENLARRFAGPHRVLLNKYYVDELYGATAVAGTMASARGLWVFDSTVVDGAVNGTG
jgi:NADH-quinone oxidoreductase subunit L